MAIEKTPEELKKEHIAELERQLAFLKESTNEWKKSHPERWEEDVKRIEDELSKLQPEEDAEGAEEKKGKKVKKVQ